MTSNGRTTIAACVVVYEPNAKESLASWLMSSILNRVFASAANILPAEVAMSGASTSTCSSNKSFVDVACSTMEDFCRTLTPAAGADADVLFYVVAIFWDALADASRCAFIDLKSLAEEKGEAAEQLRHRCEAAMHNNTTSSSSSSLRLEVMIQALNCKMGSHTIPDNERALMTSITKKLKTTRLMADHIEKMISASSSSAASAATSTCTARHVDVVAPADDAPVSGAFSVQSILDDVEKGQGECVVMVQAPTPDLLQAEMERLRSLCQEAKVGMLPLFPEPRSAQPSSSSSSPSPSTSHPHEGGPLWIQQCMLRRRNEAGGHVELRVAMCGNVDSGKSTVTSVLTRGCCDDGRGFARAFVFNHQHEATTGRTSSVSENLLGFTVDGEVANYVMHDSIHHTCAASSAGAVGEGVAAVAAPSSSDTNTISKKKMREHSPQELANLSSKIVTLYDLAGHEKYLKTTVLGMTRNMPDYACIVISANNGIQRMTKEHLVLCLALNLPFFVVVTRLDATPPNVYQETITNIHRLLKLPTVRKLPYPVHTVEQVIQAAKHLHNNRIAPIFEVSNVTRQGIPNLLALMNLLPIRADWRAAKALPLQMIIDSTFFVTGVGTVVGGILTQGVVRVNDVLLLGPDGLGNFRSVTVKSIHVKGVDAQHAEAGTDISLCLKKEKRSSIRKGNVLVDPRHPPKAYWQMEAEVMILYHSTTIATGYEPVIHASTVRQSARITQVGQSLLRTGETSKVRFHFLYRPEYLHVGQRIIFREGRTRGIGTITALMEEPDLTRQRKHRNKHSAAGVVNNSVAA